MMGVMLEMGWGAVYRVRVVMFCVFVYYRSRRWVSCWRWGGVPCRIRVVMFCVLCITEAGDGCHAGDGAGCRVQG